MKEYTFATSNPDLIDLIALTDRKGRTWYIRPERISTFARIDDVTEVYLQGDDGAINVIETPEQIIGMLK